MLRIAVQSKGRLYDDTMNLLSEADIKVSSSKRALIAQSPNFPLEVLFLRDDDIPQSVASGVADIGVVGQNEYMERGENVQILSPFRKRGAVASNALNETIRDLVNPASKRKMELKCGSRVFRVGDRIMQTANRNGVSNGDVGLITGMVKVDDEVFVDIRLLDGRELRYSKDMMEDVEFSYCLTIHKSQGQEYPVIIVPLLKEHYIMLRRNLLYTAVTRAKAKVILIGQRQAVYIAIHKCDVGQRNTVLADRIVAYYNREMSKRVA